MSFTLFAGRGHVAREIVEILEDLAALHLVDNFAWVDRKSTRLNSSH